MSASPAELSAAEREAIARLPEAFALDVERVLALPVAQTILDACCRCTGMGCAAIARVTPDRWFACAVRDDIALGLSVGGELPIKTTFCSEAIDNGREVVIENGDTDPVYANDVRLVTYGFKSYISVPIRMPDGRMFGTLCAIDWEPRTLGEDDVRVPFRLFADLIARHLDAEERVAASELALNEERSIASLREEFVAVLGHDLRNPLNAIEANAQLIEVVSEQPEVLEAMRATHASVRRMAELIGNLLDFTRARLGDGIELDMRPVGDLGERLEQVVEELRSAHPAATIRSLFRLPATVRCDPDRIAQLLSNLIANALIHGSIHEEIVIEAMPQAGTLQLAVSNRGPVIAPALQARLFEPFRRAEARGSDQSPRDGLGLGLHIVSEIAKAHGGHMRLESSEDLTTFTFVLPIEERAFYG